MGKCNQRRSTCMGVLPSNTSLHSMFFHAHHADVCNYVPCTQHHRVPSLHALHVCLTFSYSSARLNFPVTTPIDPVTVNGSATILLAAYKTPQYQYTLTRVPTGSCRAFMYGYITVYLLSGWQLSTSIIAAKLSAVLDFLLLQLHMHTQSHLDR